MKSLRRLIGDVADLAQRLDQAATTPDRRDGRTILERIRDSYNGFPGGGGGTGRSTGVANPTLAAADRPDRARDDEQAIQRKITHAKKALDEAFALMAHWQLRDPSSWDHQKANPGEPGCISCARIPGPRTHRWWNEIHCTTTLANGHQAAICRWCYETPGVGTRFTGQLPPKDAVEAHRDGRRWKQPA